MEEAERGGAAPLLPVAAGGPGRSCVSQEGDRRLGRGCGAAVWTSLVQER